MDKKNKVMTEEELELAADKLLEQADEVNAKSPRNADISRPRSLSRTKRRLPTSFLPSCWKRPRKTVRSARRRSRLSRKRASTPRL